jgi:hypothetical protein
MRRFREPPRTGSEPVADRFRRSSPRKINNQTKRMENSS